MQPERKDSQRDRAKHLLDMFRRGKGTRNGRNSEYNSPDTFAVKWVCDLDRLTRGQPTELLKNGTLVEENGHEYYHCNGKLARQMWSTKSYQVIGFYRHLRASKPDLLQEPKAKLFVAEWQKIFKNRTGDHVAYTCTDKACVRHVRIVSREQNEVDKHWQYFFKHPVYGTKFREFVENNAEMKDAAAVYFE